MNATHRKLLAIALAGLLLRLLLLAFVNNPGLHDPLHYFNLGRRLADGHGFTIDYIWHYSSLPDSVTHAIDHWMPMAGVAAALGMALAGQGIAPALGFFLLSGVVLPLLTFAAAKAMRLSARASLLSAAFTAFLPDLVWNSLRTDTTILNSLFIVAAVLLLAHGIARGKGRLFLLSGAVAGLAYLTRTDSLLFLPLAALCCIFFSIRSPGIATKRDSLMAVILLAAGFLLLTAPWLLRNLGEFGAIGSPETGRMFFMVEHDDHYAYKTPVTLESMLQRKTIADLMTKRVFELLAAAKQIVVSLGFPLVVLVPLGAVSLLRERRASTAPFIMPPLLWAAGMLLFYPLLLPIKSQAGSFEKAFLAITPLLMPFGALAIERFCRHPLLRRLVIAGTLLLLVYNAYANVRHETAIADRFYASVAVLVEALESMPDQTGDDHIRLMTQDPFILSYFGYQSIMIPDASREDTLELARRYDIDYLLMPPGRIHLDALYLGRETDDRFILAAHLADSGAEPFELYSFRHD